MTTELELRRRWVDACRKRLAADTEATADNERFLERFVGPSQEAIEILDELGRTGDLNTFKSNLQAWAAKPTTIGFNGFSGQMTINQLINAEGDHEALARILTDSARLPENKEQVRAKLSALVGYVEQVRVGAHPSAGHVPYLLSYFWALRDPHRWPIMWASGPKYLTNFDGYQPPTDPVERYMEYLERSQELTDDGWELSNISRWFDEYSPVFLDTVLCDRCRYGADVDSEPNARALAGYGRYLTITLEQEVKDSVGRSVTSKKPPLKSAAGRYRADTYGEWWILDKGALSLRVWVGADGAGIGLRVGPVGNDWLTRAEQVIETNPVAGYELLASGSETSRRDVGLGDSGLFYGRWYDPSEFADLDLAAAVSRAGGELQALIDRLDAAHKGPKVSGTDIASNIEDDPLYEQAAQFKQETGYPSHDDEEHETDRAAFAQLLQPDALVAIDRAKLRKIAAGNRYDSPGRQVYFSSSVRDADESEFDDIIDTIEFLLWGSEDDAQRIEELFTGDRKVRGLSEGVITKLLSIAHPDRYVPIYPWQGSKGRRHALQLFGLNEPTGNRGEVLVRSTEAIRHRLEPLFPGDTWGMSRFYYWLVDRQSTLGEEAELQNLDSRLEELAEELLVDRGFLDQVVALLEEKGQVIFYGPPGTGKTYMARRLAEVLATDPERRKIVQFHPSTSYEDFFEGFRPETGLDGQIAYRLTPGPLASLADEAAQYPSRRHVMIIDEINRANLPKVFGELLYLLEYRGESITTLYRPEDPFILPENVMFIGTMNTADRSIALVDAALRRRFYFIPFFPQEGAVAGLLDRWLAEHQPGAIRVGELVHMVNDELVKQLGGPDLQIGPSYFMQPDLTKDKVRLIWQYSIEPFIEDQFYGNQEQINFFRFDQALARYQQQLAGGDEPPPELVDANPATSDE